MARKFMNGIDLQNQRAVNAASPAAGTDLVNRDYVDAKLNGLQWKQAVRAASTATVTLASGVANGSVLDGVALATGDRILLKNQTAGAENGIYTVNASGAPTRAVDADGAGEIGPNATVYVSEGTVNADTSWTVTNNGTITIGTTAIVFAQTNSGSGGFTTAGAGLTSTGGTVNVGQGTGILVGADDIGIDTSVVTRKYAANVGDGAATSIAVTHNLGTKDVAVVVRQNSNDEHVECDVVSTSTTQVTLTFATAPAAGALRVLVLG